MSFPEIKLRENERLDDLMFKGRKIIQNKEEFCFSLDAVLLAHFPRLHKKDRVLELGTGTGVIPLLIADGVKAVEAVEISPVMAELAQRNMELNGLTEKVQVSQGDYRAIEELYRPESFDLVLANPPYRPVGEGQLSKLSGVARARHEVTATLKDVVRAARWSLRFGGYFAMVHLPERLGEIIVALHEAQMEVKRLRMVQPKEGRAPNMMLLEAVVGAAPGGMKVLPPLIVHEADGSYTEEIKKIYGLA